MINRRQFIWASAASLASCADTARYAKGRTETPFGLGVASGDPTADSVILWTRTVPAPRGLSGEPDSVDVDWAIAEDPGLRRGLQSGTAVAARERAYCIHVDVSGLEPDTRYYYRFSVAGTPSDTGRTRTLPAPGTGVARYRIALTSCQEYSLGYFSAYRDLVEKDPDVVIHNGDYIYEAPAGSFRPYPIESEALSLDDYRALYATYRQDADLRTAHARLPWIVIWDDHEVANDWGPDHFLPSRYNRPLSPDAHRQRVRAARQAFLEHMPLRASLSLYDNSTPAFYRKNVIGDLLEISRLDVRSYRSRPVCNNDVDQLFGICPDVFDKERSMLGAAQERWLADNFGTSGCRWKCLAQTTVMAPFDRKAGKEKIHESESWDNYAASRNRILEHVRRSGISNAISLGGNIHAFYAGEVTGNFDTGECRDPVMTEIVTTSISAGGGGDQRYRDVYGRLPENPCIQYFENRYRGYTCLDFTHERVTAELRIVDDVTKADCRFDLLARLVVEDGRLGVRT